jgi:hypothetical protein
MGLEIDAKCRMHGDMRNAYKILSPKTLKE